MNPQNFSFSNASALSWLLSSIGLRNTNANKRKESSAAMMPAVCCCSLGFLDKDRAGDWLTIVQSFGTLNAGNNEPMVWTASMAQMHYR